MRTETVCEVCGKNDWQVLGQRTYKKASKKNRSLYNQKRFRVLFDKWFPGKESITLKSILCKSCGFIIYTPRPEETDIDTKYKYIEELGWDYSLNAAPDSSIELKRSNSIFRYLKKNTNLASIKTILDYGGGDGRLMQAFCNPNSSGIHKQCYLVDYSHDCIPGIQKLSDTIKGMDPDIKFDLIVCSHVIEHIAQPVKTLKKLITHLNPGGQIFIEVPLEVWKRPPLHYEPVTHINFFTPNSLYNLLAVCGLVIEKCDRATCLDQAGTQFHGIRAIAKKISQTTNPLEPEFRPTDAIDLLQPTTFQAMHHHLYVPQKIPKIALRSLKNLVKN